MSNVNTTNPTISDDGVIQIAQLLDLAANDASQFVDYAFDVLHDDEMAAAALDAERALLAERHALLWGGCTPRRDEVPF